MTGEKGIGKSTLLQRVLEAYREMGRGTFGGFYTVRTKKFLGTAYSVHLFPVQNLAGEPSQTLEIPDEGNLLFLCGKKDGKTKDRFDRLGCRALENCEDSDLIIMDELGPHEAEAERFAGRVREILDGAATVIGVLQKTPEGCWTEISEHSDVKVLEITKANRDDPLLIKEIIKLLGER